MNIKIISNFTHFLLFINRLDDLLVGAPLYTVRKDGRIIPDAGRVDIFHQTPEVFVFVLKRKIIYS